MSQLHLMTDEERVALRAVIAMHKEHRELFHNGDYVRFDSDEQFNAVGVYAADRSEGIVSFGQQLSAHGVQPPTLHPESAVLFKLTRQ